MDTQELAKALKVSLQKEIAVVEHGYKSWFDSKGNVLKRGKPGFKMVVNDNEIVITYNYGGPEMDVLWYACKRLNLETSEADFNADTLDTTYIVQGIKVIERVSAERVASIKGE